MKLIIGTSLTIFLCLIFHSIQSQPYTWHSAGSGPWTSAGTWVFPPPEGDPGYSYPQTTDDIVIIDNAFSVTLDVDGIIIQSLTLTNSGGSYGSLIINTPNTLSTTGNVSILPGQFSNRSILNVQGPSVSSAVIEIESGATLTVNTGKTLDVGFYGILSGGTLNNNCTVNFGTNLDVQPGSSFNILTGGSVKVGP